MDYDHPDTFPDKESYREAFEKLRAQTKKKVFSHETTESLNSETLELFGSGYLIGEHNAKNLSLVMALARELGISDNAVKRGLEEFRGVRRRMEIYLRKDGLIIMDDYAHHPAEISATLEAIKKHWPEYKLSVIFQPHTYSRTKALLDDFGKAFSVADEITLLPTYSSARENKDGIENTDQMLFEAIAKNNPNCRKEMPDEKEILASKEKTIIITMGAGDVWQTAKKLKNSLTP